MTCTTSTIDPKTHPLLTSKVLHSKKAGTKDLFFAKEVILDHAVEVHEKDQVGKKKTIIARLNSAWARSLQGFFYGTYK